MHKYSKKFESDTISYEEEQSKDCSFFILCLQVAKATFFLAILQKENILNDIFKEKCYYIINNRKIK